MTSLRQLLVPRGRGAFIVNTGWLLADRGLRILLGLLVNVMLARTYGPAQFGSYAYALAIAALFVPLGTLGLERVTVRELARDPAAEPTMLGSVGLMRLVGGLAGWALATGWVATTSGRSAGTTVLVAWVAAGNVWATFDAIDWSFQARSRFRPGTLARLGAFVLGAAAKLMLAWHGAELRAIAMVVFAEALVSAVLQLTMWRTYGGRLHSLRFDGELARRMLGWSAPLIAAEVAVWVLQKADIVILAHAGTPQQVGLYSVAQRVGQVFYFLPGIVVQLFSPAVACAATAEAALALVQRVTNGLVLCAYGVAGFLTLSAPLLMPVLFGEAFAPTAGILRWLAWSNVFVFMGSAHSLYLVNRGHQVVSVRLAWLTAILSVILNLLLVPLWQARGAAMANLFTYAATTAFGVAFYAPSRPLLRVNLRALAAPVWLPVHLVRWLRAPDHG